MLLQLAFRLLNWSFPAQAFKFCVAVLLCHSCKAPAPVLPHWHLQALAFFWGAHKMVFLACLDNSISEECSLHIAHWWQLDHFEHPVRYHVGLWYNWNVGTCPKWYYASQKYCMYLQYSVLMLSRMQCLVCNQHSSDMEFSRHAKKTLQLRRRQALGVGALQEWLNSTATQNLKKDAELSWKLLQDQQFFKNSQHRPVPEIRPNIKKNKSKGNAQSQDPNTSLQRIFGSLDHYATAAFQIERLCII